MENYSAIFGAREAVLSKYQHMRPSLMNIQQRREAKMYLLDRNLNNRRQNHLWVVGGEEVEAGEDDQEELVARGLSVSKGRASFLNCRD